MFSLLRRRPKLPAEARPALARDERVVAWAIASDKQVVVATNHGLWLPGLDRLGWHQIHKAAWSGQELSITPAETDSERDGYLVVVDRPVLTFVLAEPEELPHEVRARVTRSVGYTAYHSLPSGGGVRVAARRVPGVNGLTWTVRYDAEVPAEEEKIIAATDELVAGARAAATAGD